MLKELLIPCLQYPTPLIIVVIVFIVLCMLMFYHYFGFANFDGDMFGSILFINTLISTVLGLLVNSYEGTPSYYENTFIMLCCDLILIIFNFCVAICIHENEPNKLSLIQHLSKFPLIQWLIK